MDRYRLQIKDINLEKLKYNSESKQLEFFGTYALKIEDETKNVDFLYYSDAQTFAYIDKTPFVVLSDYVETLFWFPLCGNFVIHNKDLNTKIEGVFKVLQLQDVPAGYELFAFPLFLPFKKIYTGALFLFGKNLTETDEVQIVNPLSSCNIITSRLFKLTDFVYIAY